MSKFLNTNDGKILIEIKWNNFWQRWQVVADGVIESEFKNYGDAVYFFNGFFPIFN